MKCLCDVHPACTWEGEPYLIVHRRWLRRPRAAAYCGGCGHFVQWID